MVINTGTAVNMNGEMIPKSTVQVNLKYIILIGSAKGTQFVAIQTMLFSKQK